MLSLITEVFALGLGIMIASPGIFALAVILLGSKIKPFSKSLFFILGNIFTLIILFSVWYFVGTNLHNNWNGAVRFLDILFGFILLFFAYKIYMYKNDGSRKNNRKNTSRLLFYFGLGFLISITNFDAETLYIISINEIFESGIAIINQLLLALYSSIMILLPALLPMIIYFLFPKSSNKILESLNKFLKRYGKWMMIIIFTLLGVWFLLKGFGI